MAAVRPDQLIAGFESYTDLAWSEPESSRTSGFILLLFRLLGAYNVAFAVLAIAIALTAFRRGERWAWWALLVGNTIAYGAPMIYDQIVGAIGVFEILEFFGIAAVYLALAFTAPPRSRNRMVV